MDEESDKITFTADEAFAITKQHEDSLKLFMNNDEPQEGKTAYSGEFEVKIKKKFGSSVAVNGGVKYIGHRVSVYNKCTKHNVSGSCWILKSNFLPDQGLEFTIKNRCERCFPSLNIPQSPEHTNKMKKEDVTPWSYENRKDETVKDQAR